MKIAAMQTNSLLLASGIRRLFPDKGGCSPMKGNLMSNTAYAAFAPANTLIGRLAAAIDRLLLAYAETMIRNGDVARCIV
jgi:hypothetical protein